MRLRAIDRYVLGRVLAMTLALTGAGLAVLLLGRAVGLFDILASPQNAFEHVGQMLLYLLPHLLGMALPGAFFFGILLTFNRLSRDSEIIVLMASGWGPHLLLRPVLVLTAILLILVTVILGFVAPYARYAYRSVKHTVVQTTLVGAVREGTFVHADDLTFFAEHVGFEDSQTSLSNVFLRRDQGGESIVVTARRGWLVESPDGARPVLLLHDGEVTRFKPGGQSAGRTTFQAFRWPVAMSGAESYRRRGLDQRELTLPELWAARADPPIKPSPSEISAEWNMRLVMIASIPILPLMAISLGLCNPRRPRGWGIALGLVVVVLYFQVIGFGEALVKRAILPPSVALWVPFAIFAGLAAWLFYRAAFDGAPRRATSWFGSRDRLRLLRSVRGGK